MQWADRIKNIFSSLFSHAMGTFLNMNNETSGTINYDISGDPRAEAEWKKKTCFEEQEYCDIVV